MSRLARIKKTGWFIALVSAISFAVAVGAFSIWLNWPYPMVETTDEYTIVGSDAPKKAGDIVAWTKPRVCVPGGKTRSEIKVTQKFADPRDGNDLGSLSTVLLTRVFDLKEGYCGEPNFTSFIVPPWLKNGTYQVFIAACTENPTPRDSCISPAEGPTFTVIGQPELKSQ
jgi:hypothetical protein